MDLPMDDMRSGRSNYGGGRGRLRGRGWARGRGGSSREQATGILRQGYLSANIRPSTFKYSSRTKDLTRRPDLLNDGMVATGFKGAETGTKLYVSNLDYGVSNEDIKELFSEVGLLRRSALHYDQNGRSSGSAEVVYVRRSDAMAALKRYNSVQLDGRAMKIEIIGSDSSSLPVSAQVKVVGANGSGRRTVVLTSRMGEPVVGSSFIAPRRGRGRGAFQSGRTAGSRGRGSGRARGRGRGRMQRRPAEKSANDLDKELETYHAEAMNTS